MGISNKRIGMICRMDNSGLGTLSWEFAEHLNPVKILLVQNGVFQTFPERYTRFNHKIVPSNETFLPDIQDWITEDIDILLSIETFYDGGLVEFARSRGVKTALVTMVEMTPDPQPAPPDLLLCPSKLDYDILQGNKIFIPIPVNTDRLRWKKREKAKVFIHTGSHGGVNGRKGTSLLMDAMRYVKNDCKLIIYSWTWFLADDKRVEVQKVNFKNYWQCWTNGDVLIYPQNYNGICLPIIEAMSSGLGVITTDIYPFNEYMPKELLFKPESMYRTRAANGLQQIDGAQINPKAIAEKIDEWFDKDISQFSLYGKQWAEENSWEALRPRYYEALQNL